MRLLAPDRTDAHTNAFPSGCTVLSVHQLGVFDNFNPTERKPSSFIEASVKIRYDQTKLTGKTVVQKGIETGHGKVWFRDVKVEEVVETE